MGKRGLATKSGCDVSGVIGLATKPGGNIFRVNGFACKSVCEVSWVKGLPPRTDSSKLYSGLHNTQGQTDR